MRAALIVCALLFATTACNSATTRWREEGAQQARDDIASGRPALRLDDDHFRETLVDAETGLPVENWAVPCGTGYDWDRHEGLVEGYNDVIREALERGELGEFVVSDRVRTPAALKELLAGDGVTRLEHHGDSFDTPDGRYRIVKRQIDGGEGFVYLFAIDTRTGEERRLANAYPWADVAVFADGTTAAVSLDPSSASTYDLRSGRGLQWHVRLVE